MSVPDQFKSVWPIRRTGSIDNERIQLNNALSSIMNSISDLNLQLQNAQSQINSLSSQVQQALQTVGIPEGGEEGEVLAKASDEDFAVEWVPQCCEEE